MCDALYVFLLQEFQTTQGNLSCYLGGAFEGDKAGGVLRVSFPYWFATCEGVGIDIYMLLKRGLV